MTFLLVGAAVHGITATLYDEGARPQSLVTDTLIFLPGKTLTQSNPQTDLHTDIFSCLTIKSATSKEKQQPF